MLVLQVSVLRGAWPGLFLLGLIQCRHQLGLTSLLSMVASHLQTCLQRDSISLVRVRALLATLTNIKLTASKLECLELDLQEFAYLRLFSLFRFSKCGARLEGQTCFYYLQPQISHLDYWQGP